MKNKYFLTLASLGLLSFFMTGCNKSEESSAADTDDVSVDSAVDNDFSSEASSEADDLDTTDSTDDDMTDDDSGTEE